MHIVIFHHYYLMAGHPGGSRFNAMAQKWQSRGHRISVVTGNLDMHTGQVPAAYRRRLWTQEDDAGVQVYRCHVPRSYRHSYGGRALAYAGIATSTALAALRLPPADVVIASSPPLTVWLPAWWAATSQRRRPKLIFEVRDLWPESAVTTGVLPAASVVTRALYGLEAWACRRADCISVLTPAFAADLVARNLAPARKIALLPNGADTELFVPGPRDNAARRELGWGERFVALYAGAHGRANALSQLVDAAAQIRHRRDILLACVGDGPTRAALEREARARGLDNIVFHGAIAKERMPEVVAACDVGLAVLQDNPTFKTVYPNKIFDYMAGARPTVLAIDGVARELMCRRARAGRYVPPEQPQALAHALVALCDAPQTRARMGARGLQFVRQHASRAAIAARYERTMVALVTQAPEVFDARSCAAGPRPATRRPAARRRPAGRLSHSAP